MRGMASQYRAKRNVSGLAPGRPQAFPSPAPMSREDIQRNFAASYAQAVAAGRISAPPVQRIPEHAGPRASSPADARSADS